MKNLIIILFAIVNVSAATRYVNLNIDTNTGRIYPNSAAVLPTGASNSISIASEFAKKRDITHFGATSGGADDTAAIQRAVNAARSDGAIGAIVYIPDGTYTTTDSITNLIGSIVIQGNGRYNSTILRTGTNTSPIFSFGDGTNFWSSWGVMNLTINGGNVAPAVYAKFMVHGGLRDVRVDNAIYGVNFDTSPANWVMESVFSGFPNVTNVAVTGRQASGHTIFNNYFATIATGIDLVDESNGLRIENNNFEYNDRAIVLRKGPSTGFLSTKIESNYFENSTNCFSIGEVGSGIAPKNVMVIGNTFAGAGNNPVIIHQAAGLTLLGNTFGVPLTIVSNVTSLVLMNNTYNGLTNNAASYQSFEDLGQINLNGDTVIARTSAGALAYFGSLGINTIPVAPITIKSPTQAVGSHKGLVLLSSDNVAAEKGGGIAFGGLYSGTNSADWVEIEGLKINSLDGELGGYFRVNLRDAAGNWFTNVLYLDATNIFYQGNALRPVSAGANITLSTNGSGVVSIASAHNLTTGAGITNIGSVLIANLLAGANITLSTGANGGITITGTGGSGGATNELFVNGVSITGANLTNTAGITWSVNGTNVSAALNITTNNVVKGRFPAMWFAVLDDNTTVTAGAIKKTIRAPCAFTVGVIRASVVTASSSGVVTIDINESGSTILSTKLTIDASEKTSVTAATPYVVSDSSIADDAEITIDIDTAGTDAAGLIIEIYEAP